MAKFAAALSQHPLATQAVGEVSGSILEQLQAADCDLAVCFASPHHVGAFEDIAAALRSILDPTVLVGGTAVAVVGGAREVEDAPALAVLGARLENTELTPVALRVEETPDGMAVTGWPDAAADARTLLLFADPFTFPVDAFL